MVTLYSSIVSATSGMISSTVKFAPMGVSVIVPPAWTSTFTASPGWSRASCSSAESKMMPCEFPIFEMVLIMRKTSLNATSQSTLFVP